MPLAAALAEHVWKLTGLSDGVWEKDFPQCSQGLSLPRFCALRSFSAFSTGLYVGSEMGMSLGVHPCEGFPSILGDGADEVWWVVCGRPEQ